MWPICAMCGGAGRGSVALAGGAHASPGVVTVNIPAPASCIVHEVALELWSKLCGRLLSVSALAEIPNAEIKKVICVRTLRLL